MFLTKEAVRLALPGQAEAVACDGCPPPARLSEQFAQGRGELLVCPICVKSRNIDADAFVANVRMAGPRRCGSGSPASPGRSSAIERCWEWATTLRFHQPRGRPSP